MAALVVDRVNSIKRYLNLPGKKVVLGLLGVSGLKRKKEDDVNTLLDEMSEKISDLILISADEKIKKLKSKGIKYRYISDEEGWQLWIESLRSSNLAADFNEDKLSFESPPRRNPNKYNSPMQERNNDLGFNCSPKNTSPDTDYLRYKQENEQKKLDSVLFDAKIAEYDSDLDPDNIDARIIGDLTTLSSDDSGSDTDMEDITFQGGPGNQLCPSCVTGLCDTHIQLRF